MKEKWFSISRASVVLPVLILALACAGPKITYTPKVGASSYPPVGASKVTFFETTPQKGSYIEIGDLTVEDEIKCSTGGAFEEEKALRTMEELRKKHPDMSDISDITMIELLAEQGQIDRGQICDLVPRFSRKEEKSNFIVLALQGNNLKLIAEKAGKMGANAVMKIQHGEWKMRGNPSGFGADGTQAPPLKIGVKTTAVAINYEAPEGETVPVEEKLLVAVKDKEAGGAKEETKKAAAGGKKEATKEATPPKETAKEGASKKEGEKAKETAAEKKEIKAAAKEEKKTEAAEKPDSEKYLEKVAGKEKEIKALEEAMAAKKEEQKAINDELLKDKDQMKTFKKELLQAKLKAAKLKTEEDAKRKAEAIKARLEEKKLAKMQEAEAKKTAAAKEAEAKAAKEAEAKAAAAKTAEAKAAAAKTAEAKAAAAKTAEAKAAKEAEAKAKAEEAKTKAEEAKAKEKEAVKEKAKEAAAAKKPEEEKKPEEGAEAVDPVVEAKQKIKANKSAIFECLRKNNVEGSVQVTYLFKPLGEIDALGFDPSVPDAAHKCIMELLKKEKFPQSSKYYKAIFKYTMK
jgi:hypothetical protein